MKRIAFIIVGLAVVLITATLAYKAMGGTDTNTRVIPADVIESTTTAAPTPTTAAPPSPTAPVARTEITTASTTSTTVFRGATCESSDPAITDCGTTAHDAVGFRTPQGGCMVTDSRTGAAWGYQRDDSCFNPATGTAAAG